MNRRTRFLALIFGFAALLPGARLAAQAPVPASAWDGERALELIQRAQQRRAESHADTGLVSYQADARGYVYFYLDRRDTGQRNLVKTDQLALEVFWRAPDLAKQRIVGWRDEKSLPTNINYHLDHLAVVLENFGDEIRIGDGDEVRDVLHPAAPGAERVYQYRLVDSLTLRLPGAAEPVRVYQLQVRPRDESRPAFVGSVYVERSRGDLVRMDFTFTRAAYVDRYLDHISISLDNGLWKGRFWLPNEQRLELRRQIPELDIPAGSVIRGTMRIGNYRFNEPIPLATFAGAPVSVAPKVEREAFAFEEPLDAELRAEGLGERAELADVRRQARELIAARALNRRAGLRPGVGAASDVFRYNRAEGAVLSLGLSATPQPGVTTRFEGGWAFGAEHPLGAATITGELGPLRLGLTGYANQPRDVGIGPAA
ncbi:MAG TPA: hypothetical protein VFX29_08225, partial [Longimicrobiaceae bacterium]|nr:hypothetical protein [Longimicrobiaceae bacterium]